MADDDSDDPYAEMADGGANPFGFSAAPQGAGSLASLFGGGAPPGGPGAEGDMSYRPKPQPKAGAQQPRAAGAAPKASILLSLRAREVYLFVAAENRQVPQGPCGVVFLGDMAMGAYTLLLYKSQENHLARVPFTDRFKLETTVNGLYVTLYDTTAGNAGVWTLLFQTEDEVRQYALATGLAKYGAMAGPGQIGPSILTVDMIVGTGSELTAVAGDQLGVTYTGWLRDASDPLKAGKKFDGNANKDKPFAFKLGKGKVIQGWEQGIKGMRKGGRRLLVVPPQFAYGDSARDGIPSKSTLVFEVDLVKAKFDKSANRSSGGASSAIVVVEDPDEPAPMSGSADDDDDASNDLLSRMQRIGAAVPFPGAAVNDDVQAGSRRADEEAAALAKAAAEAERKAQEAQREREQAEELRRQADAKQNGELRAAEEKVQAARLLAEEQRQAQEKMQQMQQQQLAQMQQLQQMALMQKESPAVYPPAGAWQQSRGAPAAPAYESEGDQKLTRVLSDFRKQQDELVEKTNDMLEQVDDLFDKLQGTNNGGRRGRGRSEEAISPIEMLQSLQQLVDEHGAMEQESLSKDEELFRLRQQLAEARERQAVLVEEKHQFLMQQNQVLMNQQADQRALAELQVTKESNAREQSELETQLAAALASSQGMVAVDNELGRMRREQSAALDTLNSQLSHKEAELAESRAQLSETAANEETSQLEVDAAMADVSAERELSAVNARRGVANGALRVEADGALQRSEAAQEELTAQTNLLLAAKSAKEELAGQTVLTKAELASLREAEQTAVQATEAEALSRAKTVLSGVYASLGEQFADGATFDGSVVRQAIKGSILAAMQA